MEWTADGSVMSLICRANEGNETRVGRGGRTTCQNARYDSTKYVMRSHRHPPVTTPSRGQSFNTLKYEIHLNTNSKFSLHLSQNTMTLTLRLMTFHVYSANPVVLNKIISGHKLKLVLYRGNYRCLKG